MPEQERPKIRPNFQPMHQQKYGTKEALALQAEISARRQSLIRQRLKAQPGEQGEIAPEPSEDKKWGRRLHRFLPFLR